MVITLHTAVCLFRLTYELGLRCLLLYIQLHSYSYPSMNYKIITLWCLILCHQLNPAL